MNACEGCGAVRPKCQVVGGREVWLCDRCGENTLTIDDVEVKQTTMGWVVTAHGVDGPVGVYPDRISAQHAASGVKVCILRAASTQLLLLRSGGRR